MKTYKNEVVIFYLFVLKTEVITIPFPKRVIKGYIKQIRNFYLFQVFD